VLVAALAGSTDRASAERWLRHFRFGREYGEPALALAGRGSSTIQALKDRRKMRGQPSVRDLEDPSEEALVVLWALGNDLVRGRIERFVGELSKVKAAVSVRI